MKQWLVSGFVCGVLLAAAGHSTLSVDARVQPAPDAQMKAVLDELATLGPKPLDTLTPEEARRQPTPADAVMALLTRQGKSKAPEPVGKMEDRTITGAAGSIPARVYWPKGNGPFPVVLYIHGGGWVIADLDTYDSSARALTNAAQAVVVSTHYRQGPEHKFPAAHDDTFAAYKWVVANAASIGGDPARLAVVGESAGGNMAAHVSIRARDEKQQMPVHQVLVYPVADSSFNTPSYQENATAKPLSKAAMMWFAKHYLKSEQEGKDPRIMLIGANLKGLPSTTIITAQIDPLRSEGQMLGDRLKAAGVDVTVRNFDGVTHEFFGMGAVVDKAKEAVQVAAAGLKRGFTGRR